jgi:hypothetical protein
MFVFATFPGRVPVGSVCGDENTVRFTYEY